MPPPPDPEPDAQENSLLEEEKQIDIDSSSSDNDSSDDRYEDEEVSEYEEDDDQDAMSVINVDGDEAGIIIEEEGAAGAGGDTPRQQVRLLASGTGGRPTAAADDNKEEAKRHLVDDTHTIIVDSDDEDDDVGDGGDAAPASVDNLSPPEAQDSPQMKRPTLLARTHVPIFISTASGQRLALSVILSSTTISDIKQRVNIHQDGTVSVQDDDAPEPQGDEQQRQIMLLFAGKQLKDNEQTLTEAGVQKESALTLIIRNKQGGRRSITDEDEEAVTAAAMAAAAKITPASPLLTPSSKPQPRPSLLLRLNSSGRGVVVHATPNQSAHESAINAARRGVKAAKAEQKQLHQVQTHRSGGAGATAAADKRKKKKRDYDSDSDLMGSSSSATELSSDDEAPSAAAGVSDSNKRFSASSTMSESVRVPVKIHERRGGRGRPHRRNKEPRRSSVLSMLSVVRDDGRKEWPCRECKNNNPSNITACNKCGVDRLVYDFASLYRKGPQKRATKLGGRDHAARRTVLVARHGDGVDGSSVAASRMRALSGSSPLMRQKSSRGNSRTARDSETGDMRKDEHGNPLPLDWERIQLPKSCIYRNVKTRAFSKLPPLSEGEKEEKAKQEAQVKVEANDAHLGKAPQGEVDERGCGRCGQHVNEDDVGAREEEDGAIFHEQCIGCHFCKKQVGKRHHMAGGKVHCLVCLFRCMPCAKVAEIERRKIRFPPVLYSRDVSFSSPCTVRVGNKNSYVRMFAVMGPGRDAGKLLLFAKEANIEKGVAGAKYVIDWLADSIIYTIPFTFVNKKFADGEKRFRIFRQSIDPSLPAKARKEAIKSFFIGVPDEVTAGFKTAVCNHGSTLMPLLREGWMSHKAAIMYNCLYGNRIDWYKKEGASVRSGVIMLNEAVVVYSPEQLKAEFQVTTGNTFVVKETGDDNAFSVQLTCENASLFANWVVAIQRVISLKDMRRVPDSVHEGFLDVYLAKQKIFKRCYVILTNKIVRVFARRNDAQPIGSVALLPGFEMRKVMDPTAIGKKKKKDKKQYIFSIAPDGDSTTVPIIFRACDVHDARGWTEPYRKLHRAMSRFIHAGSWAEGYLYFAAKVGSAMTRPYFVLFRDRIEWYKEKRGRRTGVMPLSGDTYVITDVRKGLISIADSGDQGAKTIYVRAVPGRDTLAWKAALGDAIARLHRPVYPNALHEDYLEVAKVAGGKWQRSYGVLLPDRLILFNKKRDRDPYMSLSITVSSHVETITGAFTRKGVKGFGATSSGEPIPENGEGGESEDAAARAMASMKKKKGKKGVTQYQFVLMDTSAPPSGSHATTRFFMPPRDAKPARAAWVLGIRNALSNFSTKIVPQSLSEGYLHVYFPAKSMTGSAANSSGWRFAYVVLLKRIILFFDNREHVERNIMMDPSRALHHVEVSAALELRVVPPMQQVDLGWKSADTRHSGMTLSLRSNCEDSSIAVYVRRHMRTPISDPHVAALDLESWVDRVSDVVANIEYSIFPKTHFEGYLKYSGGPAGVHQKAALWSKKYLALFRDKLVILPSREASIEDESAIVVPMNAAIVVTRLTSASDVLQVRKPSRRATAAARDASLSTAGDGRSAHEDMSGGGGGGEVTAYIPKKVLTKSKMSQIMNTGPWTWAFSLAESGDGDAAVHYFCGETESRANTWILKIDSLLSKKIAPVKPHALQEGYLCGTTPKLGLVIVSHHMCVRRYAALLPGKNAGFRRLAFFDHRDDDVPKLDFELCAHTKLSRTNKHGSLLMTVRVPSHTCCTCDCRVKKIAMTMHFDNSLDEVAWRMALKQEVLMMKTAAAGAFSGERLAEEELERAKASLNVSFDMVSRDPVGLNLYLEFARAHYHEEVIRFFLDIQGYKGEADVDPKVCFKEKFVETGKLLTELYVREGAQSQVNLSSHCRSDLASLFDKETSKLMDGLLTGAEFDAAADEVLHIITCNSFPQFLTTEYYERLVTRFWRDKGRQ